MTFLIKLTIWGSSNMNYNSNEMISCINSHWSFNNSTPDGYRTAIEPGPAQFKYIFYPTSPADILLSLPTCILFTTSSKITSYDTHIAWFYRTLARRKGSHPEGFSKPDRWFTCRLAYRVDEPLADWPTTLLKPLPKCRNKWVCQSPKCMSITPP